MRCHFVTDLHGRPDRYAKLFEAVGTERPGAVFLGGDLLPHASGGDAFVHAVLGPGFRNLRSLLGEAYPRVFLILGNDDGRMPEEALLREDADGLWHYAHGRSFPLGAFTVHGYCFVPPTPFRLKDWEKYDVSAYVPPGCVSPEEGVRSLPVPENLVRHGTIRDDLEALLGNADLKDAVILFHTPPCDTALDRAALDGKAIDHVPLDLHVGSVAVRRFIEKKQPLVTLHGHVHESARLTGSWRERLGRTWMLGGAHDGPELALVRFDPGDPGGATRELL